MFAINDEENNTIESQFCPVHPDRETYLRCAECNRPICDKCMVQTPVGTKCPDCARHRGRTTGQAKPIYIIRAAAAGAGAAVFGGFVLALLRSTLPVGMIILAFLAGIGMGEIVSRAARRQTGRNFQIIAGVAAALMFFLAGYFNFFRPNLIGWVIGLLGTYLAVAKLSD